MTIAEVDLFLHVSLWVTETILENGENCLSKILLLQILLSTQFLNIHFPIQSSIFGQLCIYLLRLN